MDEEAQALGLLAAGAPDAATASPHSLAHARRETFKQPSRSDQESAAPRPQSRVSHLVRTGSPSPSCTASPCAPRASCTSCRTFSCPSARSPCEGVRRSTAQGAFAHIFAQARRVREADNARAPKRAAAAVVVTRRLRASLSHQLSSRVSGKRQGNYETRRPRLDRLLLVVHVTRTRSARARAQTASAATGSR